MEERLSGHPANGNPTGNWQQWITSAAERLMQLITEKEGVPCWDEVAEESQSHLKKDKGQMAGMFRVYSNWRHPHCGSWAQ